MKLIEHARNIDCHRVSLVTFKTMYAAVALYKKLGFRIVGHTSPDKYFKVFNVQLKYIYPMIGERALEFLLEL